MTEARPKILVVGDHAHNRILFHERLDAAFARSSRQRFALAYVNLDGLDGVNDRFGQAAGDAVLVATVQRLTRALRASDTVARLGEDRFALLFEGLDTPAGAEHLAWQIHRALTSPVLVQVLADQVDVEIAIGASIGVVICPERTDRIEDLVALAEIALHAVKRAGGGVRVYAGRTDPARPGEGNGSH